MAADRGKLPAELLADVKNQCDVTWADEATDRKYLNFIAQGIVYLDGKLGEEADYTQDGMPRTLLMEYVRYARDSALDVFENNYLALLLNMQNGRAVARFVESSTAAAK